MSQFDKPMSGKILQLKKIRKLYLEAMEMDKNCEKEKINLGKLGYL